MTNFMRYCCNYLKYFVCYALKLWLSEMSFVFPISNCEHKKFHHLEEMQIVWIVVNCMSHCSP